MHSWIIKDTMYRPIYLMRFSGLMHSQSCSCTNFIAKLHIKQLFTGELKKLKHGKAFFVKVIFSTRFLWNLSIWIQIIKELDVRGCLIACKCFLISAHAYQQSFSAFQLYPLFYLFFKCKKSQMKESEVTLESSACRMVVCHRLRPEGLVRNPRREFWIA